MWRVHPDCRDFGDASGQYQYSYDALGRATLIEQEIAGLTPMVSFAQQFDAAGRRTRLAAAVGSTADFLTDYLYDRLGRVVQRRGFVQPPIPRCSSTSLIQSGIIKGSRFLLIFSNAVRAISTQ